MANQRVYHAPDTDLQHLADTLSQWMQSQGLETQVLPNPGGLTLQARHTSWVQRWGGGVALSVMMMRHDENMQVQVGTSKWTTQAVSGVAAAIIFWPLLALPAYAAYKQKELIDGTWQFIGQYVASGGQVSVPAMVSGPAAQFAAMPTPSAQAACPSCGKPVRADAKFCPNCGAKLELTCSGCGASLRAGSKFCDNCGASAKG